MLHYVTLLQCLISSDQLTASSSLENTLENGLWKSAWFHETDLAAGEPAQITAAHPCCSCQFCCCFLTQRQLGWKNCLEVYMCKGCMSPAKLHLVLFCKDPGFSSLKSFCIVRVMQSDLLQKMITCYAFYRAQFALSRKLLDRSLC